MQRAYGTASFSIVYFSKYYKQERKKNEKLWGMMCSMNCLHKGLPWFGTAICKYVWIWGLAWSSVFLFDFSAGTAAAQIDLDWTNQSDATWIMGEGTAEEHTQIKIHNTLPTTCTSCSLFAYVFFQREYTLTSWKTNRTVVTLLVFTQSCLLARMKWNHWHKMDGAVKHDNWQAHV